MIRKLICVSLLLGACDRQAPKPATVAPATTHGTTNQAVEEARAPEQFPEVPPDEVPIKKMPVAARALEFDAIDGKPAELTTVDGEAHLCWEIFADEDRVAVTSGTAHTCRRERGDEKDSWALFATDTLEKLVVFDKFGQYSDALDTIEVHRVPDGTDKHLGSFVDLKTGEATSPAVPLGYSYHFVDGAPLTVVTMRAPDRSLKMTVAEGVPTGEVNAETPLDPPIGRDNPQWDLDRNVITYSSRSCLRATLSADGTDVACEVRVSDELRGGNTPRIIGDSYLKKGYRDEKPTIAIDLKTGEQTDPTEGTCAAPYFPHIDSANDLQRLLIACTGEGRPNFEPTEVFLWTPQKRVPVLNAPWKHDRAFGNLVSFVEHSGNPLGPPGEVRWLDLRRFVYWQPGPLYLAGDRFATNARPLQRTTKHELYLVDDEVGQLQPLDTVECESGRVYLSYRDDEVVSVVCAKAKGTKCGRANAPSVDHSITFDLRTKRRIRTDEVLVGVTRNTLLFSKTDALRQETACDPQQLATMPR